MYWREEIFIAVGEDMGRGPHRSVTCLQAIDGASSVFHQMTAAHKVPVVKVCAEGRVLCGEMLDSTTVGALGETVTSLILAQDEVDDRLAPGHITVSSAGITSRPGARAPFLPLYRRSTTASVAQEAAQLLQPQGSACLSPHVVTSPLRSATSKVAARGRGGCSGGMAAGGNGRQGRRTKGGPLPLLALLFAGWALSPGQAQPPGGSDGNTTALDCADTDALLLACDADGMALAPPPPAPTGGQLPPASLRLPERDRLCAPACLDNLVACAASAPTPLLAYAARTCTDDQAAQPALDAACAAAFASACEPAAAWEQGGASTRLCSLECSALVDRAGCRARLGVSSADVGGLCDRIAAAPPGSPTAPACLAQLTESPCFQPLLAGDSGTGSSALLTQLRGASSIRAAGWGSSAAPCGPGCSELAASDCGLAVLGSDAPGAIANHCSACDEKYATACEGGPPWSDVSSLPSASLSAALASPLWERCSPACAAFATDAPDCFSDSATPATDASQCSPELPACMEAVLTDCAVDATAGNGPGRPPLPSSGLPSALCSPACVQRLLDDTACAATLKEAVFGGVDLQTELPQVRTPVALGLVAREHWASSRAYIVL